MKISLLSAILMGICVIVGLTIGCIVSGFKLDIFLITLFGFLFSYSAALLLINYFGDK